MFMLCRGGCRVQGIWLGNSWRCASHLLGMGTATALVILVSGVYGPADALVRGGWGTCSYWGWVLRAAAFSSVRLGWW